MRALVLSLTSLLVAASVGTAQPRHTGRTVLHVELVSLSDARVDARCGPGGYAYLPVRARVLAVEEGVWPHAEIVLGWPVCGGTLPDWGLAPGQHHRVRVRIGSTRAPDHVRHVRWSEPLP